MAKTLKIYGLSEPILKNECRTVTHFESWVLDLTQDMWETMLVKKANGLAANQVGYDYKIITINTPMFQGPLINPEIVAQSDENYNFLESCLSAPFYKFSPGKRSKFVSVKYIDLNNTPQLIYLENDSAAIIQHEIDHLYGISFLDYLDERLKKV